MSAPLVLSLFLQGLPPGFDLPPFTAVAKGKAVGNGVPVPMARAVARAVKRAVGKGGGS